MSPAPLEQIKRMEVVVSHFGEWPSFHDAEISAIRLERAPVPAMEVDLYAFQLTDQVGTNGYLEHAKPCRLTLRFEAVRDLALNDWNEQNVIGALAFDARDNAVHVSIWGLNGCAAEFDCDTIEVVALAPT